VVEPPVSSRRGGAKKGGAKNSEEHSGLSRKKNRAPRMQNVGVQIKPDNKLKVGRLHGVQGEVWSPLS